MLDYLAVLVVASNHSRFSLDAETTTGTDRCQSTNMRTLRLTFGYRSFDHITRLKPMYPLNGFRTGKCTILFLAPEPIFVGITHLALSTSHRLDLQRLHTIDIQRLWRCFTNTNRIQPMRFGQVTNRSVILVRPPVPTSTGNPVASRRRQISHRVAHYRSRVFQWRLGLFLNFGIPELIGRFHALRSARRRSHSSTLIAPATTWLLSPLCSEWRSDWARAAAYWLPGCRTSISPSARCR